MCAAGSRQMYDMLTCTRSKTFFWSGRPGIPAHRTIVCTAVGWRSQVCGLPTDAACALARCTSNALMSMQHECCHIARPAYRRFYAYRFYAYLPSCLPLLPAPTRSPTPTDQLKVALSTSPHSPPPPPLHPYLPADTSLPRL